MLKNKYLISLLLAAILVVGIVFALEFWRGKGAQFDESKLAQIDAHMQNAITRGVMIGGQGVIMTRDKVVYSRIWGQSDREAQTPITKDAIYRIYSMTKPIISVAIMMLVDDGKLALNTPIGEIIPELANLSVHDQAACRNAKQILCPRPAKTQPTIRDLLNHSSGLSGGFFDDTPLDKAYRAAQWGGPDVNFKKFVSELGKLPLVHDPNQIWRYSLATDVLGYVIEVVSGKDLPAFLHSRIFTPLHMQDTGFVVPKPDLSRLTKLYSPMGFDPTNFLLGPDAPQTLDGLEPASPLFDARFVHGVGFPSGAGGLVSTSHDYLHFMHMLLNEGKAGDKQILSRAAFKLMTQDSLGDAKTKKLGDGIGFGLGFSVVTDAKRADNSAPDGTFGWGGAAGTVFWIDPVNQIAGLFLTQSIPHRTKLRDEFRALTYQALK